jgi:hypothetical protein
MIWCRTSAKKAANRNANAVWSNFDFTASGTPGLSSTHRWNEEVVRRAPAKPTKDISQAQTIANCTAVSLV